MARDRASRPEAKALRLFVAIEIPQAARALAEDAFAPLRELFPKARWVPGENLHVTLKFLGWTYPRLTDWVRAQVGAIADERSPLETRLAGVGAFPSSARARVLWVGLEDLRGQMAEIAQALDAGLSREFRPENRAFRPHLTLARSDPPLKLPADFETTVLESEPFPVERLVLFRSHLQRPAPRYERVAEFPLRDRPGAGA